MSEEPLSPLHTFAAAGNLLVDRLIAEVHDAFAAASVEAILLKGPAIAGWLYDEDEIRVYGDGDFLVARAQWEAAGSVLRELGFWEDIAQLEHPNLESFASYPWGRESEGAGVQSIDLHATLSGIGADFPEAWSVLSSGTSELVVGGRRMRILGEPARAMHIALHAAHHHKGKPMLDLERALQRLGDELWSEAAEVAASLGATAAFATGLRLTPAGEELARRLGVHEARSVAATLKLEERAPRGGARAPRPCARGRGEARDRAQRARAHARLPALVDTRAGPPGTARTRRGVSLARLLAGRPPARRSARLAPSPPGHRRLIGPPRPPGRRRSIGPPRPRPGRRSR